MPGRLVFFTTPSGSTTPAERMRIDNAGVVRIVSGELRIDKAPVAEAVTCTHTLTINVNGTNYKFPCVAA